MTELKQNEKATPPQEKKALTEESQKENMCTRTDLQVLGFGYLFWMGRTFQSESYRFHRKQLKKYLKT